LVVAPLLTAPFPAYVSLQTALYRHGMISQMPAVTYVVSPARTRLIKTPVGVFSVHHLATGFFFGYDRDETTGAALATPEKALLDFLYLGPARSGWFAALPELDLPPRFSLAKARRIIARIPSEQRRSMLARRFEKLTSIRGDGKSNGPEICCANKKILAVPGFVWVRRGLSMGRGRARHSGRGWLSAT
jgi:hypothetical protein